MKWRHKIHMKNKYSNVENHWPKLIILDTIGIAIGDNNKITNIINETIKRNGIITEKWVIRKLIGKPIIEIATIISHRWLRDPEPAIVEKIAEDIIEQLRVSFAEKINLHIQPELLKFLKLAKEENCKIVGISWLPAKITDEIFANSDLPKHFHSWVSYDQTPRFQPFPDIIQQISQKENIANTESIAQIGISKIALLTGYHAQCKWNILIHQSEEDSEWTAYPFSHSIKEINGLIQVFQPPTKQKNKKLESIFKKEKPR